MPATAYRATDVPPPDHLVGAIGPTRGRLADVDLVVESSVPVLVVPVR